MKILKWILLVLAGVLIIGTGALTFWGGHAIKHSVNLAGPKILGVPLSLKHARLHPLKGYVSLSGLIVGNPEGFNTDSLFEVQHLEVDLDMSSLFSDTIIISRILVDSPQITYEIGLRRTNLGALLENLKAEEKQEAVKKQEAPEEKAESSKKTVIIEELQIIDARAQVSASALGGKVIPIQLAPITLNNLGGQDQSLTQITEQVLKALLGAVGNAVAGAGDLLGDGLKSLVSGAGDVGGMAVDGLQALTGAIGEGLENISDLADGDDTGKPAEDTQTKE